MVKIDGVIDAECIGRLDRNEARAPLRTHTYRAAHHQRALIRGEVLDAGFVDEVQEHPRRTVEDGNLGTIEFHINVIHTRGVERGK